jgi:hypothetical protein
MCARTLYMILCCSRRFSESKKCVYIYVHETRILIYTFTRFAFAMARDINVHRFLGFLITLDEKGQICALRSLYEGVGLISCLEILRYFNNIHKNDQEHIKFT